MVLTLSNCDLTGPIHASFARLHSLSVLTLHDNSISAPVPTFFANFSRLTSLSLARCNLHGEFPKEILQIPTLEYVDISSNAELSGSLPEFRKNASLESIFLYETKFSGVLPESIGNLKMLSTLHLAGCNFSGAVPKSLANLTQLTHLFLSSNKFSSPISTIQWQKLTKLTDLQLDNNLLYGSIPSSLFAIPMLQWLVLSKNLFTGQLLEFSNVCSKLLYNVDLSSNHLEGSVPISILHLPSLQVLLLPWNNLTGFPFYGLNEPRNLSILDLSHNNFSIIHNAIATTSSHLSYLQIQSLLLGSNNLKTFPSFLKNQSSLATLDLSDNQIQGQIPNWIWGLPRDDLYLSWNNLVSLEAPLHGSSYHLVNIDLHSNQLQGQIPLFVRGSYMDYSRNNFSSSIPADIGDFISSTTYISLSSSNLFGGIPKSMCNATGVVVLDLSNNSLSGTIPRCLMTQTSSLSVLDLRRNNLTGSIPYNFVEGCSLKTLALSRNQLTGQFPKSLAKCSSLEVINLGINQLADTFPCTMKNISTLRVLVLRSNQFYGSINCLKTNGTWPKLQIIDLARNNFDGEIPTSAFATWHAMMVNEDDSPADLGFRWITGGQSGIFMDYDDTVTATSKGQERDVVKILTIFTLIDFSANKFNGTIPEEIGQLRLLYVLNLSSNVFAGEIPLSFGNMISIESLDLSRNQLGGHIPMQLTKLTFLSYLNVSNNQLTGKIPTSTQFSTFPSTAFEGNKGLWGPPLTEDIPAALPPPASNGNSREEIDWDIISVEVGFTCGFGVVVGSILLCRKWREWCYKAACNILLKIFTQERLRWLIR